MKYLYSIIIPVFNEDSKIPLLLSKIEAYSFDGHEILIVDDGSTDSTYKILSKCNFISLLRIKHNQGKGYAIRKGLGSAKHNQIVVFDGDIELDPIDVKKLMILDAKNDIKCVFGNRYKGLEDCKNIWDLGNILFSKIFNIVNRSRVSDALCCAKSFYLSDIDVRDLKSIKFDIDVELANQLVKKVNNIKIIHLNYKRRGRAEGKKLKMIDGLKILKRILVNI